MDPQTQAALTEAEAHALLCVASLHRATTASVADQIEAAAELATSISQIGGTATPPPPPPPPPPAAPPSPAAPALNRPRRR